VTTKGIYSSTYNKERRNVMSEKDDAIIKMDEAAEKADKELRAMAHKDSIPVARWFKAHYMGAGHKRLGRVLVAFAKETETLKPENFAGATKKGDK
jgi:hypothetical protein